MIRVFFSGFPLVPLILEDFSTSIVRLEIDSNILVAVAAKNLHQRDLTTQQNIFPPRQLQNIF